MSARDDFSTNAPRTPPRKLALIFDDRVGISPETVHAMQFRDPPDARIEAEAVKREVALTLFKAHTIPVDLPRFGLRLLDLELEEGAVSLIIVSSRTQRSSPSRIRLALRPDASQLTATVSMPPGTSAPLETILTGLSKRLEIGVPLDRWTSVQASIDRVASLPVGVPMEHMRSIVTGIRKVHGLVRTGFRCNQNCGFCWQKRSWKSYGAEALLTWIEDLAAANADLLTISGGEPTLDPDLRRYVARARELGIPNISLETNAIQLSKGTLAADLRESGLTHAFVSLHSGDAEVSDAITRAPGTHRRTVEGIQRLLDAGVLVRLNVVMTDAALATLPDLPSFIGGAFKRHPGLEGLMVSHPSDCFDVSLLPSMIPDPDRTRAALGGIIAAAEKEGLALQGLDGPCGPPLCAHGADRRVTRLLPVASVSFRQYLPPCDDCSVRKACFGVRPVDARLFGDRCVAPIVDANAAATIESYTAADRP